MDQQLIVNSLRGNCLFERADEDALASIARHLRRRRFRRNETIFHQGDPGDALHIVSSGAVKIVLSSMEGDDGFLALEAGQHDLHRPGAHDVQGVSGVALVEDDLVALESRLDDELVKLGRKLPKK